MGLPTLLPGVWMREDQVAAVKRAVLPDLRRQRVKFIDEIVTVGSQVRGDGAWLPVVSNAEPVLFDDDHGMMAVERFRSALQDCEFVPLDVEQDRIAARERQAVDRHDLDRLLAVGRNVVLAGAEGRALQVTLPTCGAERGVMEPYVRERREVFLAAL